MPFTGAVNVIAISLFVFDPHQFESHGATPRQPGVARHVVTHVIFCFSTLLVCASVLRPQGPETNFLPEKARHFVTCADCHQHVSVSVVWRRWPSE